MKKIAETPTFLSLPCIQIEILSQTKQEMSLSTGDSISQLVLDWIKRSYDENEPAIFFSTLMEKVCFYNFKIQKFILNLNYNDFFFRLICYTWHWTIYCRIVQNFRPEN